MLLPLLATLTITGPAKAISPDLFGIFFEDLNYAADGGLYAELIQNRSFEYAAPIPKWNALTAWEEVKEDGSEGKVYVRDGVYSIHPNNPHYVSVYVEKGKVGLRNEGFDGIVLKAGESYDFSVFSCAFAGAPGPLTVRLEGPGGEVLASTTLPKPTENWEKLTATLVPHASADQGRLVILASGKGSTGIDMVSLFPRKTFRDRANGLRADLAQAIADLKPKFVRFPGGCIVHGGGYGICNLYDWKKTVGPVETRRAQPNSWGYYQSLGIGYFEYFQFCEDIGAKPLPVVPAGVSCQNSDFNWGKGQEALPESAMKGYVQDVLDLVEFATGSPKSKWGRVRAEAGHPKPFKLEYLAIGNEEAITPVFGARFKQIHDAVKARYPRLKLIGTVGPFAGGEDFENGWKFARKEQLAYVDEHYYVPPDWFWQNLHRYDGYNRSEAKVYAGEYAAHEKDRANTLRAALAEAAHLTSLERNGDVVHLASYAPLLAKQGHTQWHPDLIYFDNHSVFPSLNYQVQKLFMHNSGDLVWPSALKGLDGTVTGSVVQDTKSGDVILKVVSRADQEATVAYDLSSIPKLGVKATRTVLSGEPLDQNLFGKPAEVLPKVDSATFAASGELTVPPSSLTLYRISRR